MLSPGFVSAGLAFVLALASVSRADDCPSTTTAWKQWSESRISSYLGSRFDEANLLQTSATLERCSAPNRPACLDRLAQFARWVSNDQRPGHSLGLSMSDTDYYADVPYPEMMELPPELADPGFLELMDHNDLPGDIDRAVARIGQINQAIPDPAMRWVAFEYVSQHLSTPDGTDTYGRFFIYVPGPDYDRFFQFGIRENPSHPLPNGLSVVTVQKTDPSTRQPLAKPLVRIKDFWRLRNANGVTVSTRLAVEGGMENCFTCHKEPVLPINPDPTRFDAVKYAKPLAFVNRLIARYATAVPVGIDLSAYGPGLGPVSSELRTDDFIRRCSAGVVDTPDRIANFRDAMKCARCHDGGYRGVLSFPSALRPLSIGGTLPSHYLIDERKMPPGADLTQGERKALLACLTQELYHGDGSSPGELERWLRNDDCWNRQDPSR